MILRASEESVSEESDRSDVRRRYEEVAAADASRANGGSATQAQQAKHRAS